MQEMKIFDCYVSRADGARALAAAVEARTSSSRSSTPPAAAASACSTWSRRGGCSASRPSSAGPRGCRSPCQMDSRDRGPLARLLGARVGLPRGLPARVRGAARVAGAGAGGAGRQRARRRRRAPGGRSGRAARALAARDRAARPAGRRRATLVAVVAGALLLATLRARVVYGTALATGRLIHIDLVPALRARVFDKLLRLGHGFFQRNASGSIINRVTADVQSLRSFIDGVLLQGALLLFTLAVYVAYMVHVHVGLTVACLAPTPLALARDQLVLALGAPRLREEPRALRRDGAGDVGGGEGDPGHQDVRRGGAGAGAVPPPQPRRARPAGADLPARQPVRARRCRSSPRSTSRSCSATAARWWRATR